MKKKKTFLQNNMIVDVQMCKTCFKDMAKPTIVVQDNMMILRLRTLTQHIFSRIKTNLMVMYSLEATILHVKIL